MNPIGMMSFMHMPSMPVLEIIRVKENRDDPILFKVESHEGNKDWYVYGKQHGYNWDINKLAKSPFQTAGPDIFHHLPGGGESRPNSLNLAYLSDEDYNIITLQGRLTLPYNRFKRIILLKEFTKISKYLSDNDGKGLTPYYKLLKENHPALNLNIKSMMRHAISTVDMSTIIDVMKLLKFNDLCEKENILAWTGQVITSMKKESKQFRSKIKHYRQFKRDLIKEFTQILISKLADQDGLSAEEENSVAKKNYDSIIEIFQSIFKEHKNEFLDAARVLIQENSVTNFFIANFYFYLLIEKPDSLRLTTQKLDIFRQLSNTPLTHYIPKYFFAPTYDEQQYNDDEFDAMIDRWSVERKKNGNRVK